jgi:hypothetical protein
MYGHGAVGNLETLVSSFAGNPVTNIDRRDSGAWVLIDHGIASQAAGCLRAIRLGKVALQGQTKAALKQGQGQ